MNVIQWIHIVICKDVCDCAHAILITFESYKTCFDTQLYNYSVSVRKYRVVKDVSVSLIIVAF